jgi:hypothetical protein
MKQEWAREEYMGCCARNERSGLVCFKKLRSMRKGSEKGRYPLCSEDDDAIYIYITYIIKMFGKEEVEGTVFK